MRSKQRAMNLTALILINLSQHYYGLAFITRSSFDNLIRTRQLSSHIWLLPPIVSPFRTLISRRHDNIGAEIDDVSNDKSLSITDEDALLACRAYLQRKNRLGWIQYERRKKLAQRSLALASPSTERSTGNNFNSSMTNTNSGVGYFWEDPNELKYLRKSRNLTLFDENDEQSDVFYRDEESKKNHQERDEFYNPSIGNVGDGQEDDEKEDEELERLDLWDNDELIGMFNSFPKYPSDERRRRSESRKALFQNAEFKAKWYEKRWGAGARIKACSTQEKDKRRKLKLVEKIPSKILDSPELAALTDEEINDAIQTYITANKKRSKSFAKRVEARQIIEDARFKRSLRLQEGEGDELIREEKRDKVFKSLPICQNRANSLSFFPDETNKHNLKKAQLKRSKKAAEAYQTRRENMAKKALTSNSDSSAQSASVSPSNESTHLSPEYFLDRIRTTIDSNEYPSIYDVKKVMEPTRLAGRKDVLIDMLVKCFKMKGECVPKIVPFERSDDDKSDVLKYMRQSTVHEIGAFAIYKLQEISSSASPSYESIILSPKSVIDRIRTAIDSNEYPSIVDIEKVVEPTRLAGRKDILIDVLMKCFKMKGKCVPKIVSLDGISDGNIDGIDVLEFVTKSTVHELGAFVICKLQEKKEDDIAMRAITSINDSSVESLSVSLCCEFTNLPINSVLDKIRSAIDSNECPSITDIEKVMEPTRLAGRKDVLIDVLMKCFKMKGKCVPKIFSLDEVGHDDSDALEFLTKSTVNEIGALVICKLHEYHMTNQNDMLIKQKDNTG